jgi:hypothetical protein
VRQALAYMNELFQFQFSVYRHDLYSVRMRVWLSVVFGFSTDDIQFHFLPINTGSEVTKSLFLTTE